MKLYEVWMYSKHVARIFLKNYEQKRKKCNTLGSTYEGEFYQQKDRRGRASQYSRSLVLQGFFRRSALFTLSRTEAAIVPCSSSWQHRNSLSTNQDRRWRHDIRAAWFRTASSAGLLCPLPLPPPARAESEFPPPRPGKFKWGVKLVSHTQTTSSAKN